MRSCTETHEPVHAWRLQVKQKLEKRASREGGGKWAGGRSGNAPGREGAQDTAAAKKGLGEENADKPQESGAVDEVAGKEAQAEGR